VASSSASRPATPCASRSWKAPWATASSCPRSCSSAARATRASARRGEKITIFKMKRRKGYRRKTGHRQYYTEVRVDEIEA